MKQLKNFILLFLKYLSIWIFFMICFFLLLFNFYAFPSYYYSVLNNHVKHNNCQYWSKSYNYIEHNSIQIWLIIDTIETCNLKNHKDFLISQLDNENSVFLVHSNQMAKPQRIKEKSLNTLNKIYNTNYNLTEWKSMK